MENIRGFYHFFLASLSNWTICIAPWGTVAALHDVKFHLQLAQLAFIHLQFRVLISFSLHCANLSWENFFQSSYFLMIYLVFWIILFLNDFFFSINNQDCVLIWKKKLSRRIISPSSHWILKIYNKKQAKNKHESREKNASHLFSFIYTSWCNTKQFSLR